MDKGFSINGYLLSRLQPDDSREARLFMTAGEAESTRYVMRLQIWYTHYCCVEELLTLCRLQRHREEHLEAICHRMLYYFREARIQCGMPSTSKPERHCKVAHFKLLDASYEHINRKVVLQAEELLGIHTDHSFIPRSRCGMPY